MPLPIEAELKLATAALDLAGASMFLLEPGSPHVEVSPALHRLLQLTENRRPMALETFASALADESGCDQLVRDIQSALAGSGDLHQLVVAREACREAGISHIDVHARLVDLPDAGSRLLGVCLDASARAGLEQALREASPNDPLTGLFNRKFFEDQLVREWRISMRENHDISLILVRIAAFGRYREARGNRAGDELLGWIGRVVAGQLSRASDMCARYSGTSFAMLLPRTGNEGAMHLAERIHGAFADELPAFWLDELEEYGVRLNVGVGSLEADATALGHDVLLARAQAAVYYARKYGNGLVESWREDMPEAPWALPGDSEDAAD